MRVIGLDFGLKRIGVAVSDEGARLAQPLKVLPNGSMKQVMDELGRIIAEYSAGAVVMGDPRQPGGGEGKLAPQVRELASLIQEKFGLKVVLRDERYTSFEAGERLREAGETNWRSRKEKLDQAAAAIILQDYLDSLQGGKG